MSERLDALAAAVAGSLQEAWQAPQETQQMHYASAGCNPAPIQSSGPFNLLTTVAASTSNTSQTPNHMLEALSKPQ
jgi:hypothetical protein